MRLLVFFLLAWIVIVSQAKPVLKTHDSINYLRFAEHIIGQNDFKGHAFTHSPPLYPLLIAAVVLITGFESTIAAALLNSIFFAFLITLLYFIFDQILSKRVKWLAFCLAFPLLFFDAFSVTSNYNWTEIVYTAFSLLTIFSLQQFYRCSHKEQRRVLLKSAFMAALALMCRYIGYTLLLTGAVMIFSKNGFRLSRERISYLSILVSLSIVSLAVWVIRNILISHTLFGSRAVSERGIAVNLMLMTRAIQKDFSSPYILGILIAGALGFVFLFIKSPKINLLNLGKTWIKSNNTYFLYIVMYFLNLSALASFIHFDPITTRLMMPIYPFIIVVGMDLYVKMLREIKTETPLIGREAN